eukprot:TRINITY_DN79614_c0_g1_i1.p1 TRINITY_DN79614_c0_g1~~TRINITY_DN79614_c0_g1_i1.p1  ORF type:complete len:531 (+),score=109.58 TRINITY_DN79614_c0_g1_i1:59-1651(+)
MPLCFACLLATVSVVHAAAEVESCNYANWTSTCHKEVMDAMLHGFSNHPENFVGLTTKSGYVEFQAYFWNAGMHNCPRPCMAQEEACVIFSPSYPCYKDVQWASQTGIASHPEWYPELHKKASLEDIASVLYKHGQPNCPRPCDKGEPEGHFVPYKAEPEFAKSEEWMMRAVTSAPTIALEGTPTTATTSSVDALEHASAISAPELSPVILPQHHLVQPGGSTTNKEETEEDKDYDRLKEILKKQRAPALSTAAPDPEIHSRAADTCGKPGVTYEHLDMYNAPAQMLASSRDCRIHCRSMPGAGYFSFYGPLGLCHCVAAEEGEEKSADSNFIGGPVDCDVSGNNANKDAVLIEEKISDDCFERDQSFTATVGEPLPVYVKDSLACQKELQHSDIVGATYFVFSPTLGSCRVVLKDAISFSMPGFISGPKHCEEMTPQSKAAAGKVFESPLSPDHVVQKLKAVAGVLALTLVASGAFFGFRRRLEPVRARQFRSTSRSISGEWDAEGLQHIGGQDGFDQEGGDGLANVAE